MKLQNLHEAKYDQPKLKKGLENLLKFFRSEEVVNRGDEDVVIWHIREGLVAYHKGLLDPDDLDLILFIEFDEHDPRKAKEVMITYQNMDQAEELVKDFIPNVQIHQTRQLY